MLLSALSLHRGLLRALRASGVSVAGHRAFVCGSKVSTAGRRAEGAGAARGSLSVLKTDVPHGWCRCLSSSGPSSLGQLIYTGSLGSAVRGVKAFSYTTSGTSLLLMPYILQSSLGSAGWALQAVFCGVIGFFTFLTPIMLHLITKGYVVRLYHDPGQDIYTAVTYSVLLTEKRTVFHQGQVRIPDVSKMFTTFYADRTGLLVNPDLFSVPQDYNHLMGYDKPFSFSSDQLDKS